MSVETLVEKVISEIIEIEGRAYTNDPNDPGGPTRFGITLKTLREWRKDPRLQARDVQVLTEAEARRIYFDQYVVKPGFTQILALSSSIGIELVDSGVNCGTQRAGMWLQMALNAFNRSNRSPADYQELKVDGAVGFNTVNTLSRYLALRRSQQGEAVMTRALNTLQGAHYLGLGTKDAKFESFMFGWFRNRIS